MSKAVKAAVTIFVVTFAVMSGAIAIFGTGGAFTGTLFGVKAIEMAGLSAISTLIGGLMSKGVDAVGENFGSKISTRSATNPRQIIYGKARVGGTITHIETSGTDNHKLSMIVSLAGHELESLDEVLINDISVTSTSVGLFQYATNPKFKNTENDNKFDSNGTLLRYKFIDGSQTTADSSVTANTSLTTSDKFIDVAYVFIEMVFDSEAFGGGIPPMSFVVKGKKVFDPRDSNQTFGTESTYTWSDNPALCVLDYITNTTYGLKATADEINTSTALGSFKVAANTCDIDTNTITTATVNGAVSGTQVTLDISNTITLIDVGQIVTGTGIVGTVKVASRDGNIIQLSSAQTIADGTTLTIKEKSYTANGITNMSADGGGVIEGLLSSCAGKLSYIDGKFVMFAGATVTPDMTITDDNLLAPITVQTRQTSGESFNQVKSIYIDANNNYVATDSPLETTTNPATSNTFLSEDTPTGEAQANYKKTLEVQLPFTDTSTMAQRLQRTALLHTRQKTALSVVCNIAYMQLQPFDWVYLTNERLGYTNKVFEVLSTNLEILEDDGVQVLATRLDLKEINNSVYNFASSSYTNPLDEGSSVSTGSFSVSAPTGLSVSATLINTGYDLNVQWTNIQNDNIQGTEILYGTTSGTYTGSLITGKGVAKEIINNVKPNTTYYIVARHFSNNNVFSSYTSEVTINTASTGDITAPSTPTLLSATTGKPLSIGLSWTNPSNSDLRDIKIYRSTSSGFTPNDGTNLVRTIAGVPSVSQKVSFGIDDGLVAGTTYYFKVKAVSFFDKESSASSQASGSFTKVEATDIDAIFSGYFHVEGSTTTALTDSAFNTAHGRLPIEDDILIMVDTSASPKASKAYKYSGTSGSGGSFVEINNFQTGDLVVDGTIAGSKIVANDITANQIATETITANELATDSVIASKINVTNLQAISSDLGSITAGSLNIGSGNFTVSTAGVMTATGSTISGNVTTTTLVVTEDADVIGNLKATSLASNIVKITNLHQEVWNEIDARTATTQNGFYDEFTSAGGVGYIGVEKNFELLGSGNNGYQVNSKDVTLRGGSVSFIGSSTTEFTGTALQFTAQYQYKLLPSGNWTNAGSSYTATADVAESGGTYYYEVDADPDATITGLTSGSYYQFRLKISPVVTTNVFRVSPTGAADSNGITVIFEVQQSSTSTGTGAGTVTSVGSGDGLSGGPITGSGTLTVDSTVVRTSGVQTLGGNKTFSDNVVIQGDLDVQGTTTTIDTTNLDVADKNITLNYSTGDSSASANGAGITIQDAVSSTEDATLTWNTANDSFNFSHNLNFADNIKARFGAGNDLQIFHNGTKSVIQNSVGHLEINNLADDSDILFKSDNGSGGTTTYFMLDGSLGYSRALQNIRFDDNVKATFGTGNDLQIFHNGTTNVIKSTTSNIELKVNGGGNFKVGDEFNNFMFVVNDNSDVQLYHGTTPSLKLATTSSGIDVTGNITIPTGNKVAFDTDGLTYITEDQDERLRVWVHNTEFIRMTNTTTDELRLLPYGGNVFAGGNLDVTGTVTADGLTSSQAAEIFSNAFSGGETPALRLSNTSAGVGTTSTLEFIAGSSDTSTNTRKAVIENTSTTSSGSTLNLFTTPDGTNLYKRMMLANNGDISFYEDTGSTAKFFWDASAERLGIGTTVPSHDIHIEATDDTALRLTRTGVRSFSQYVGSTGSFTIRDLSGTPADRLVIDSSGNFNLLTGALEIGGQEVITSARNLTNIGTISTSVAMGSSPTNIIYMAMSGNNDNGGGGAIRFDTSASNTDTSLFYASVEGIRSSSGDGSNELAFFTAANGVNGSAPTRKMTIDEDGRVLVGTTDAGLSSSNSATGINLRPNSASAIARSGGTALYINRLTDDGDLVAFRRDGATVGSIASKDGDITIGTGDTGLRFNDAYDAIYGANSTTQAGRDASIDLGMSTQRFKDLHLSGTANVGTIASTGSMTLDVGGNLTIDVDGTTITLADGGLPFGQFYNNASGQFNIKSPTQDKDIVFLGNDGGTTITALTLDMSAGGNATFSGDITSSGNIVSETTSGNHGIKIITGNTAEGFLIFGDAQDNSMGGMAYNNSTNSLDIDCNNGVALSFNSDRNATFSGTITSGNIIIEDATPKIFLTDTGNNPDYQIINNNGVFTIYDGTNATTRLTINSSGNATFAGDVTIGAVAPQTNANFNLRRNGANIEFGHNNRTSGYYGTLGAFYNNGQPYLGFSADANESGNTFNTRGFKGNLIYGNTSGDLIFAQLTNANATGQTPTTRLTINASGNANFSGDVSVTSELNVGQQITASGGITTDQSGQTISGFTTIRVGDALIGQDVATLTTTATTQTNRILASATTYRTLKVIVQIKSSTNFHATEILLTHNGTTVYMTEYATIFSNNSLATFDADISGGNIRLLIDPNQSASTEFKFNVSGIEA